MPPQASGELGVRTAPASLPASAMSCASKSAASSASMRRSYSTRDLNGNRFRAPMETQVYISDIAKHVGEEVTLRGWLYNKRSSGKLHFLEVRDGSGIVPVRRLQGRRRRRGSSPPPTKLHAGERRSTCTGKVREDTRSALGFELGVKDLTVLAAADARVSRSRPRSTAPTS